MVTDMVISWAGCHEDMWKIGLAYHTKELLSPLRKDLIAPKLLAAWKISDGRKMRPLSRKWVYYSYGVVVALLCIKQHTSDILQFDNCLMKYYKSIAFVSLIQFVINLSYYNVTSLLYGQCINKK